MTWVARTARRGTLSQLARGKTARRFSTWNHSSTSNVKRDAIDPREAALPACRSFALRACPSVPWRETARKSVAPAAPGCDLGALTAPVVPFFGTGRLCDWHRVRDGARFASGSTPPTDCEGDPPAARRSCDAPFVSHGRASRAASTGTSARYATGAVEPLPKRTILTVSTRIRRSNQSERCLM